MANEQNLKVPTSEQAREYGRKGGKASAEARKRKRDIKMAIDILLEKEYRSKDGEQLSGAEVIALKQMEKALKGDTKAFEVIRDTAGQKPVEKVMVTEVSQDVIDEVERALYED